MIVGAFALGALITSMFGFGSSDLPILLEARSILLKNGLNPPPEDPKLEYGMIHGMVQAYGDPFTSFVEPAQHELQTNQLTGSYGGIGARIEQSADGHFYLLPFPDSPALIAGIQENDQLVSIDDAIVTDQFSIDEIAALIRGPVNSKVKIEVLSAPDYTENTVYQVKREEVALPSIEASLHPEQQTVGIIKINIIAETTPAEITNAMHDLQSRGAVSFVIDLRNNGGGLLDAGIESANLFLSKDDIVIQKQAKDAEVETISAKIDGEFASTPIVVLINENTASAAEIFAGALQANQRSQLFGHQSFGKNTIQMVFNLQDQSSLHVTAAEWWFPALPNFSSANGLVPDTAFPELDSMDPAILEAAINALPTQ